MGGSDIKAIMSKQIDPVQARKLADHVIKNDEKSLIVPQIVKLHSEFTSAI